MTLLIVYILLTVTINEISCSRGDRSHVFKECLRKCQIQECLDDELFLDAEDQPFHLKLLNWGCKDECKYDCMWETVEYFQSNNGQPPQFFGKWPFIRFIGIQEPASVVFSILNFMVHLSCIKKFRKSVRTGSPMYWVWHAFTGVSLNAWFWSTIFHTRDTPLTEFLDYSFAFSIILMSCYCMVLRVLRGKVPHSFLILTTSLFAAFFLNHVVYLNSEKFDYTYNMAINLLVGGITVLSWYAWSLYYRKILPHAWKAALFFTLFAASTVLEVFDRPPWFYIIDCHALWHLSSAPITYILYSFMIDDCKYLREHRHYKDIELAVKRD